jgi:hypothetical protein
MTPRWCVERSHESIPFLPLKRENVSVGQAFFCLAQSSVEHELINGFALSGCRQLQGLLCGAA